MLTRHEYNELYRLIEAYTDAWEKYAKAINQLKTLNKERVELGNRVVETKEQLLKYLKEQLVSQLGKG